MGEGGGCGEGKLPLPSASGIESSDSPAPVSPPPSCAAWMCKGVNEISGQINAMSGGGKQGKERVNVDIPRYQ